MVPVESIVVQPLAFPEQGQSGESLLAQMREMKGGDADWKNGRVPLFVFKGSDEVAELGRLAFAEYFTENALGGGRAFPSVRIMEQQVVGMALDLFQAPPGASGFMTTGGSESIILAVRACRDHARAKRHDAQHRGNIVAADTLHPAFDKAAALMDLTVRRLPTREDFRADPDAMAAAIDADTIMIVGSAPCFPFGVFDPIAELAGLARTHDVWFHVDACVGGYLAPFVRALGRPVPDFDFAVEGVCSMSADLHKYGFCPKPSSTVLYRSAELAAHQPFDFDAWPSGRFVTPTIVGTRPAGGVAAAWAVLNHLGASGYRRIASQLMAGVDRYHEGVRAIGGLEILGKPELAIAAFTADDLDVFALSDRLQSMGYVPGLLRSPPAIHRMMSMLHVENMESYLTDLQSAVRAERQAPASGPSTTEVRY